MNVLKQIQGDAGAEVAKKLLLKTKEELLVELGVALCTLQVIRDHELGCLQRGVGYDRRIHSLAEEALERYAFTKNDSRLASRRHPEVFRAEEDH